MGVRPLCPQDSWRISTSNTLDVSDVYRGWGAANNVEAEFGRSTVEGGRVLVETGPTPPSMLHSAGTSSMTSMETNSSAQDLAAA